MKIKFINWIYWVLAFLPVIITGAVFNTFPRIIPAHFGANGIIDRYGNKLELFIFPAIIVAMALLFWFSFYFINKSVKMKGKNGKIVDATKIILMVTLNVLCYAILITTYNYIHAQAGLDLYKISAILISIVNIVFANLFPKCRRNGFIGIRLKWTLANDDVWYLTHRFGGWFVAACGIICIILCAFFNGYLCLYIVLLGELVQIVVLSIYSYRQYNRLVKKA